MPAVMRACAVVEKAGIPAIAIGGEGFTRMGQALARGLQIPYVPIMTYPGQILTDTSEVFNEKAFEIAAGIIRELTADNVEPQREDADEPVDDSRGYDPTTIVATGNLDQIQELFYDRHWSDGLPIVPPTIQRIDQFLSKTQREPSEVLGTLLPSRREATVWNAAVNGVMAGCRPEYFPVLLAVVEAIADPAFRLEDAGSTPGWEPLITISGPLARELGFNSAAGALRVGRRANTSVGRFLRLFMRNVPGFRIPPFHTDQAAIGLTFNVVLAEDDEAIRDLGWATHRSEAGFADEDTVVTVRSVVAISAPIYSGGSRATDHLATISSIFRNAIGPWFYLALENGQWHPLLVMTPYVAKAIARDGYTKDDIRSYLYNNVRVRAADLDAYAPQVGSTTFSVASALGRAVDPDEMLSAFLRPDWTDVIVAGNPGRNQSRAYVNNHGQGVPVTKRVAPAR
jgi:hypothetical protein